MGLPRFDKLREYLMIFSHRKNELNNLTLDELIRLRQELLEAMWGISGWMLILKRDRKKIKPANQDLIKQTWSLLNELELQVAHRIAEIEKVKMLDEEWDFLLLPEPIEGQVPLPDYRMILPYESDDLFSLMDESWLPVDLQGTRGY